jgi:hypothetical protein
MKVDEIQNFLVNWYTAENIQQNHYLFKMLIQLSHQIVFKDDSDVTKFIASNTIENGFDNGVRDITPYEINRIILHAIIESPQNWPVSFDGLLVSVLALLRKIHDDSAPLHARALGKDSYPIELMEQLYYLHREFLYMQSNSIERPRRIISDLMMPWNIKTFSDWLTVEYVIDEKTLEEMYQTYKVHIDWLLIKNLKSKDIHLGEALRSLPKSAYGSFVNKYIKTIHDLKLYMKPQTAFILQHISYFTELLKTIKNYQDFRRFAACFEFDLGEDVTCYFLIKFMKCFSNDVNCRYNFLVDIIGVQALLALFTNPESLMRLIYTLAEHHRFKFLKEVFLDDIIKNNYLQEWPGRLLMPFDVGRMFYIIQKLEYKYLLASAITIYNHSKDQESSMMMLQATAHYLHELKFPDDEVNQGIKCAAESANKLSVLLLCHNRHAQNRFLISIDQNYIHGLIKTPEDFIQIDKSFQTWEVRSTFRLIYFGESELNKFIKIYKALHAGQSKFYKIDWIAEERIGNGSKSATTELEKILQHIACKKHSRTAEAWRLMLAHNADKNDQALLNNIYLYAFNRSGFFKASGVKKSLREPFLVASPEQKINLFAEIKPGTRRDKINTILQPVLRRLRR